MSHQGTWADALVIQAVVDALSVTLQSTLKKFASVTDISSVRSETGTTFTVYGHVDETHYVSTVPFNKETVVNIVISSNQPAQLTMDHCRSTNGNETIANILTKGQKRKAYMKKRKKQ